MPKTPRWRPSLLTWVIATLAVGGAAAFLYPSLMSWLTQYDQSKIVMQQELVSTTSKPTADEQLAKAYEYNSELSAGAVLGENANKPSSDSQEVDGFNYNDMLKASNSGMMARLRIQKIGVDLPVYHGTDDDTLNRGAGHLEGSSLPVGGESTHSVITAHRGLASARMFTDLDRININDTFVIEVFGEVLTYQVFDKQVVEPTDSSSLVTHAGQDIVTLVTCTPLGVNSHRILVTGKRVTPTPIADIKQAGQTPNVPGFPWWALWGGLVTVGAAAYLWRAGLGDARAVRNRIVVNQKVVAAPQLDPISN